jgi:ADP-ribosylglycohydrolase
VKDKAKAMVLASFAADSLALAPHWIYDTGKILRDFGRVDSFLTPAPGSYHATKQRGDFTHYGDQAFVLLESLAASGGFDLQDFSSRWRKLFRDYRGYVDKATRTTLSSYASGKAPGDAGSPSEELGGASRIAPVVYCYRNDHASLVGACIAQTRMTHRDSSVVESSRFFGEVAWMVLHGTAPVHAMKKNRQEHFESSPLAKWVQEGIESRGGETIPIIARFGQSCGAAHAFPAAVHLIAKYETNLKEALVQSVMAGGDSAARGMVAGMILGAHVGLEGIPEIWISELRRKDEILRHLAELQ